MFSFGGGGEQKGQKKGWEWERDFYLSLHNNAVCLIPCVGRLSVMPFGISHGCPITPFKIHLNPEVI